MDEYLFVVLAKLKADRLKLAREERIAAAGQRELFEETRPAPQRHSRQARWSLSRPDWPVRT